MSSRPEEYQRENRYCWICCVDASHPEAVPPSLSSMQVSRANEVILQFIHRLPQCEIT